MDGLEAVTLRDPHAPDAGGEERREHEGAREREHGQQSRLRSCRTTPQLTFASRSPREKAFMWVLLWLERRHSMRPSTSDGADPGRMPPVDTSVGIS